jgi:hypothetical protein
MNPSDARRANYKDIYIKHYENLAHYASDTFIYHAQRTTWQTHFT